MGTTGGTIPMASSFLSAVTSKMNHPDPSITDRNSVGSDDAIDKVDPECFDERVRISNKAIKQPILSQSSMQ
jgi:hypothetical protein